MNEAIIVSAPFTVMSGILIFFIRIFFLKETLNKSY